MQWMAYLLCEVITRKPVSLMQTLHYHQRKHTNYKLHTYKSYNLIPLGWGETPESTRGVNRC